jgi:hypothetical protein
MAQLMTRPSRTGIVGQQRGGNAACCTNDKGFCSHLQKPFFFIAGSYSAAA